MYRLCAPQSKRPSETATNPPKVRNFSLFLPKLTDFKALRADFYVPPMCTA